MSEEKHGPTSDDMSQQLLHSGLHVVAKSLAGAAMTAEKFDFDFEDIKGWNCDESMLVWMMAGAFVVAHNLRNHEELAKILQDYLMIKTPEHEKLVAERASETDEVEPDSDWPELLDGSEK